MALNENDSYLIREDILHKLRLEHEARMNLIYDETSTMLVKKLGAEIKKDGDEWCCVSGNNIQEGICGFGKTPYDAVTAFRKEFYGEENIYN